MTENTELHFVQILVTQAPNNADPIIAESTIAAGVVTVGASSAEGVAFHLNALSFYYVDMRFSVIRETILEEWATRLAERGFTTTSQAHVAAIRAVNL